MTDLQINDLYIEAAQLAFKKAATVFNFNRKEPVLIALTDLNNQLLNFYGVLSTKNASLADSAFNSSEILTSLQTNFSSRDLFLSRIATQ